MLKKQPQLVNQWLQWPEDRRTNEGWYFIKEDNNKYFVGHYPKGKELKEINTLE